MRLLFCALLLKVMATGLPQGRLLKDGISAWLGVRYADQPERFQRASLANDWKDEPGNSMDKPAKACPQAKFFPGLETSEDCLFFERFWTDQCFFYPHFPSSKFHPNLGLDDTHLAIKFISKNIHEFGGDPSQITLIGHSAGACSAHALAISTAVDQGALIFPK
ncbi:unnamed protein product, partial [Mesorhabditis belari]|uniref:Carboxylic ester hydrolase n=1 Tax=Mesorhabditis belari TaxID=2138241 RepID=A0AAF3EHX4_9BILA